MKTAAKKKIVWMCKECGATQAKWSGNCSACKEWNTLEESSFTVETHRYDNAGPRQAQPILIQDIPMDECQRIDTSFQEFDRLMGGGLVIGSLILLGGDPGIGKSTLLLQLSSKLSEKGLKILYVCGEESTQQTSLRARRLNLQSKSLYLFSETMLGHIKLHVERLKPDVLILDSVQILFKEEVPSAPGSVVQVREVAMEALHLAKGKGITTFLVGHITKSGEIAGPKVLEHLVDTVLEFEGDRHQGYRLLRSAKNRFGPTDEIAIFQMTQLGLKEILNPSAVFLQERSCEVLGSVIIPAMEGTRAILIEAQALVAPSSFSTSTRRCAGIDQNRLALLLAVLEKRLGYQLYNLDIFVSIAGGLKITEPAVDLGLLLAIASSFCNKSIESDAVVMGEVGLSGEIRSIPRIENRIKEAIQMGFKKCIIPKKNLKELSKDICKEIFVKGVDFVEEAVRFLLN